MERHTPQKPQALLSTSDLAKWIRTYAWTSLIVGVVLVGVTIGSTFMSLGLGSSTEGYFASFAETLRTIYIAGVIGSGITLLVFFMLALEFKKLAESTPIGSHLLTTINKILIVSIVLNIVGLIIGYFNMQQMISLFESIDFTEVTIFQAESLMAQMETTGLVSELINLIPLILELFAFYKFNEWVKVITAQYNYHGGTKDLHKTSNLIVIGKGLILGAGILALISDFGGLISFGGLIVMLLGYFQTATILDSGFYNRVTERVYPQTAVYTPPGSSINASDASISSKINFCPMCGKESEPGASFCPVCGTRFDS
ncbi:MAG: zinc ribbon domain-containing protein [Promethearchaeota archaeon]